MEGNHGIDEAPGGCEDGDLCVCESHRAVETVISSQSTQESEEEFPLLPGKVDYPMSPCSENERSSQEHVQVANASCPESSQFQHDLGFEDQVQSLKLQVGRKRQRDVAAECEADKLCESDSTVDYYFIHNGLDTSEDTADEVDGDVTTAGSSNTRKNKDGNTKSEAVSRGRKKRKCVKENTGIDKLADNNEELEDCIDKKVDCSAAVKDIESDKKNTVQTVRSPRKRAKKCKEGTTCKTVKQQVRKGSLQSKTDKDCEHISESNTTEPEPSITNKNSAKRTKEPQSSKAPRANRCRSVENRSESQKNLNTASSANKNRRKLKSTVKTDKPVNRNHRSRSLEMPIVSTEQVDINVDYDLKFPGTDSPLREGSTSTSMLNLSLPTPTGGAGHTGAYSNFQYLNSDSIPIADMNSSDSDDDLPEGLTPMRCNDKVYAVEDLVWAKFKTSFYIPAIVQNVYKKKRKVTLVFFTPEDNQNESITISYGCILPFLSSKKDEIMESGQRLAGKNREYFKQCMDRLESFLSKRAKKQLKNGSVWSFFKPEELEYTELAESEEASSPKPDDGDNKQDNLIKSLSKRGKLRQAHMSAKSKPLTDFLISDTTKEYLRKIFLEEVPSDLQEKFKKGTTKERMEMKHRGFGPIDDESQIESILNTYLKWLQEWNKSPYLHKVNYIFDVWVPEAVVNALVKVKSYSKKKALEMFEKGVRRTKEELQLIHEELLRRTEDDDSDTEDTMADTCAFKPKKLILK